MANLNGTWLGTYWQQGVPTRFELSLVQGGNTISGSILDDSRLGEASLVGEVIGRRISFTKRYLTSSRYTIDYTGTVSEEGNFMEGTWEVKSFDSGPWEAHRTDNNLSLNVETRRSEKVPALT